MLVTFAKYHGAGNDFIIIDDRAERLSLSPSTISQWCHRRTGVGADGLILLRAAQRPADFEMIYFNADGKIATFCGNGGRCIADFAYHRLKAVEKKMTFLAADGLHQATLLEQGRVALEMQDVASITRSGTDVLLNTGSPHLVRWVSGLEQYPVTKEGRSIRYSPEFEGAGINVNFIEGSNNLLFVRTYERGVEAETLACGTGVVAAAIASTKEELSGSFRVPIQTRNGDSFEVSFEKTHKNHAHKIRLTGPVCFVYEGTLETAEHGEKGTCEKKNQLKYKHHELLAGKIRTF